MRTSAALLASLALSSLLASPVLAQAQRTAKPAAASSEAATAALLDRAIAGPHRSEANRARDRFRNPKETLLFFGLRPEMTVVEITPAAGWFTEVLAPVLRDRGRLIAAHNNPNGTEGQRRQRAAFLDKLAKNPEVYDRVAVTSFGRNIAGNIAAPGSVDMILTFRNVHNWQMNGFAPDAFRAFYTALKPGGILGIEEHRLPESRPDNEQTRRSGYMKESAVIALAEAAGFRLVGRSEVNANPKDTADWPKGVWTLPPTLAEGQTDRDKYLAIGESDRMTLKFQKPPAAAAAGGSTAAR